MNIDRAVIRKMKKIYSGVNLRLGSIFIPKKNVLGIFMNNSWDDIDSEKPNLYTIISIPDESFIMNTNIFDYEGNFYQIIDIRNFKKGLLNSDFNMIQLLFTRYYIINPEFNAFWTQLQDDREEIALINRVNFIETIYQHMEANIMRLSKGWKKDSLGRIRQYWRFYFILENYINGYALEDSLFPDDLLLERLENIRVGAHHYVQYLDVDDEEELDMYKKLKLKEAKDLLKEGKKSLQNLQNNDKIKANIDLLFAANIDYKGE
jgi:hypothetical protein